MYVNINIEDTVKAIGTMIEYKGNKEVGMGFLQDLYVLAENILSNEEVGIQYVADLLSDPKVLAERIVADNNHLVMKLTIPEVRRLINVGTLAVYTNQRRQVYPSIPDRLDMSQSYTIEKLSYTDIYICNHTNNLSIEIQIQQVAGDSLDAKQAGAIEEAIVKHRKDLGL